jgi:hypothetical protein
MSAELALTHNTDYRDIVDAAFLRRVLEDNLQVILGAGWITRATIADAPGEILMQASYHHAASSEVLLRLPEGLVHLILSDRSLVARVGARSSAAAESVRDQSSAAFSSSRRRHTCTDQLVPDPDPAAVGRFEQAMLDLGGHLGLGAQRPELETGDGPDALWMVADASFLVIECKSGATTAHPPERASAPTGART